VRAVLAAAVAAMVEVDDLGDIGECGIDGPVNRMVKTRAAVQHQSVGFSRITGPSGTSFVPSTSENSFISLTDTCMARPSSRSGAFAGLPPFCNDAQGDPIASAR